jgi:hypothetical protein
MYMYTGTGTFQDGQGKELYAPNRAANDEASVSEVL